jgi:hypothetical protein
LSLHQADDLPRRTATLAQEDVRKQLAQLAESGIVPATATATKSKAIRLFNGKDLTGWKTVNNGRANHWVVGAAEIDGNNPMRYQVKRNGKDMINSDTQGVDLITEQTFGDCTVEFEFMLAKRGNSGIFLNGQYEIQLADMIGVDAPKIHAGFTGGIYSIAAPTADAAKPSGQWQRMVIEFRAPRFEGNTKTANAKFIKVTLNGKTVQENVEVPRPTSEASRNNPETARGPIGLQGSIGVVAFRDLIVRPAK